MQIFFNFLPILLQNVGYALLAFSFCASLYFIVKFRFEVLALDHVPRLRISKGVIVFYIAVMACNAILGLGLLPKSWQPWRFLFSQLLTLLTLMLPPLILSMKGYKPLNFWNLHAPNILSYLKLSFKILLAILIPLYTLAALSMFVCKQFYSSHDLQPSIEAMQKAKSGIEVASMIVFAVFFAPFFEEITFRGFFYPALKTYCRKNLAIWICSIFFALMHVHTPTFLPLLVFSIVLIWVYEATGSLGYSIALHMFFNATSCFLLFAFGYL